MDGFRAGRAGNTPIGDRWDGYALLYHRPSHQAYPPVRLEEGCRVLFHANITGPINRLLWAKRREPIQCTLGQRTLPRPAAVTHCNILRPDGVALHGSRVVFVLEAKPCTFVDVTTEPSI